MNEKYVEENENSRKDGESSSDESDSCFGVNRKVSILTNSHYTLVSSLMLKHQIYHLRFNILKKVYTFIVCCDLWVLLLQKPVVLT